MSGARSLGSSVRSGAGLHVVEGVLIAPAPSDFSDESLTAMGRDVLAAVHGSSLRSVLIDVSRMEIMDPAMFGVLAGTARKARLLGARTVFVGFQPGVVSTLIDMDVDCSGLVSAATLEDGLSLLRADGGDGTEEEPEPDEEDADLWPDEECPACEDLPEEDA